jgi:hypothetical protein
MMFAFAGTIATWIDDDWNLVERVVGFNQVDRHEHTGSGSARVLFEVMKNIGTASKMSTFRPLTFHLNDTDSNPNTRSLLHLTMYQVIQYYLALLVKSSWSGMASLSTPTTPIFVVWRMW